MVKYKDPIEQQLKKHERLQFLTKNDFGSAGEYVERKKVNGDTWRLQITTTHVKDFKWLASRAKRKLSYLKLSGVQVDSWEGIEQLAELRVLDLEKMDLSGGLPPQIAPLVEMRALIVMNCGLRQADHLDDLKLLNTLIIGKNELSSLPACISTFTQLEKISFTGNDLTADAIPDLSECTMLQQIRLSHNRRLTSLPEHFGRWSKGGGTQSRLEILYLASTGLSGDDTLAQIFEHESLRELTISNTPLIENHEALYEERCKASLPSLKIYNNTRFDPNYVDNNRTRKPIPAKQEGANKKEIRAARREERQVAKIQAAEIRGAEIRLLRADKDPPPKLEKVLTLEETEALEAKKAAKRERKKIREEERLQMRRKARIMAGVDPDPPPEPNKRKRKLPSKAERKAYKQLKNEERFERRKKRFAEKAQRKREKALKSLDKQPGIRIMPDTNGSNDISANNDFISFADTPETSDKAKKPKREKRKQDDETEPTISLHEPTASSVEAVVGAHSSSIKAEVADDAIPSKKKRKTKREATEGHGMAVTAEEEVPPAKISKRKHRQAELNFSEGSEPAVTAQNVHDALTNGNDARREEKRKKKRAKSIEGSAATDGTAAETHQSGANGHTSVVSVTDHRSRKSKKRKEADGDLDGVLGGDRMAAISQW